MCPSCAAPPPTGILGKLGVTPVPVKRTTPTPRVEAEADLHLDDPEWEGMEVNEAGEPIRHPLDPLRHKRQRKPKQPHDGFWRPLGGGGWFGLRGHD
jgi:hypothetical protein